MKTFFARRSFVNGSANVDVDENLSEFTRQKATTVSVHGRVENTQHVKLLIDTQQTVRSVALTAAVHAALHRVT